MFRSKWSCLIWLISLPLTQIQLKAKSSAFFSIRQNPTTFKPIIRNPALCVAKVTSNERHRSTRLRISQALLVCLCPKLNDEILGQQKLYYKLRQEKEIGLRFWLRGHKIVHVCRDLQINLPRSFGHPAVVEAQQPWPLQSTVYCCCSRCKTFAKNWDNDVHYQSFLNFCWDTNLMQKRKINETCLPLNIWC